MWLTNWLRARRVAYLERELHVTNEMLTHERAMTRQTQTYYPCAMAALIQKRAELIFDLGRLKQLDTK